MKKWIPAIAVMMALSGCTKGDDPLPGISSCSADINGLKWTANEITWTLVNNQLQIEGKNGNRYILFYLPSYTGPRTYDLSQVPRSAVYVEGNTEYQGQSGTLTVSLDDRDRMKGSFSFQAVNGALNRRLESGSFVLYK